MVKVDTPATREHRAGIQAFLIGGYIEIGVGHWLSPRANLAAKEVIANTTGGHVWA